MKKKFVHKTTVTLLDSKSKATKKMNWAMADMIGQRMYNVHHKAGIDFQTSSSLGRTVLEVIIPTEHMVLAEALKTEALEHYTVLLPYVVRSK